MEQKYVAGIDIGGQTAKIGIVDSWGRILSKTVIRTDIYGNDEIAFVADLAKAVNACIRDAGADAQVKGLGVGAPNGNYYTGEISFAANLSWASGKAVIFSELLESQTGLPVVLTNDANAAAMGEMMYGAAKGMKNFIMITLGTGVGSGIVVDGRVLYGHDGYAGELGHVIVERGGRKCGCGRKGCLETYCSATGVVRTAKEWLERGDESILKLCEDITAKEVYDAAKANDEMALRIFEYTGAILGRSFADFIAFSAPEAIILFGGLARSREFLYEPMYKAMNENVLKIWKNKVKILFSQLNESDAAILGASALAWEL